MFELIKSIEVDRKNSLPVADLHARYKETGTPVIFGNLTYRWLATSLWSLDYLAKKIGKVESPIYSNVKSLNDGQPYKPVFNSSLQVYLDELTAKKHDLRVSNLPIRSLPNLERDFKYPRLGFDFNKSLTSLSIGAKGAVEPMRQSSSIAHTVYCHFGEPLSVLLIPPAMSGFMYRVGNSQYSIRDIDFEQPQLDKYPALKYLSGYVAELNHGDSLYIPAGFWHCIAYNGIGINLSFESIIGGAGDFAGAVGKALVGGFANSIPYSGARLARLESRAISETNARLLKHQMI